MDQQRFDALARALAAGTSRRRVLKGLAAGLAGGVGVTAVRSGTAAQACLEDGATCTAATECCSGVCEGVCLTACETHDDCGEGSICCAGVCREIECCIDNPDPNETCPEGTSCFEGQCDPLCVEEECAEGACCCPGEDRCAAECCEQPPVTNLPDTGIGDGQERTSWLGVAALGGAAAYLASRKLRQEAPAEVRVDE